MFLFCIKKKKTENCKFNISKIDFRYKHEKRPTTHLSKRDSVDVKRFRSEMILRNLHPVSGPRAANVEYWRLTVNTSDYYYRRCMRTHVVGSSRNNIDGLVMSSKAMDSLFFWPPESRLVTVSP